MRRLVLAAAGAALAAGFAPTTPARRPTRLREADDEDAADLAFLGRAMKAKSKKNAAPLAGFDPLVGPEALRPGPRRFRRRRHGPQARQRRGVYGKRKSNSTGPTTR